jgi:hypothetical protein
VKLVEYCYDLHTRQVLFAYFKSYQSQYLDLQYRQNVGGDLHSDIKILKKEILPIDFYNFGPNQLKATNVLSVGHRASSQLIGFQYELAIGQSRLNQFLEWRVQKQHNWKNYLQILRAITRRYIVAVGNNFELFYAFNSNFIIYRFILEPQMDLKVSVQTHLFHHINGHMPKFFRQMPTIKLLLLASIFQI